MAKGAMIKVDRGDGNRFRIREGDFKAFQRRYPHAFIVGAKETAAKAPPAASEAPARLDHLNRTQLDELAVSRGLNPSDYANKTALVEALQAGEGQ